MIHVLTIGVVLTVNVCIERLNLMNVIAMTFSSDGKELHSTIQICKSKDAALEYAASRIMDLVRDLIIDENWLLPRQVCLFIARQTNAQGIVDAWNIYNPWGEPWEFEESHV
jgi:hypothetical protein